MPSTGAEPLPSRTWGVSLGASSTSQLLIDFTVALSTYLIALKGLKITSSYVKML